MKKQKTICFVAGRSGGHIIPALTLAQNLKDTDKNIKTIFFSTNSTIDKKILKHNKTVDIHIELSLKNVPYKKIFRYPIFFANISYAILKSFFILARQRPEKVICMGGYISLPICITAFTLRIPVELYELNAVPGKAIKFLSPFARTIHTCFKKAILYLPAKKCQISAYPVRYKNNQQIEKAYNRYNLSSNLHTILILGGSQGSVSINNIIKQFVTQSADFKEKIQIIHQTGTNDTTNWQQFYENNNIKALSFTFKNDLQELYHMADTVICRSGAGTLFETIFFKKKCITIPLETDTTSHQVDNAQAMQQMYPELVTMIQEKDLRKTPVLLKNKFF